AGELDNLAARARGEVTHRLLQTIPPADRLPGEECVAAALVGVGVPRTLARDLAPAILAEAAASLEDPFLQNLLKPESAVSEWALEDQPVPGVIRRGRLDLLAFDGAHWWLVDFKTSRPPAGENWDDFLSKEAEKYRPQLLAYREMTAKLKGIAPPESIRLALYFTACQKAVEL
ncbi:MAG: PD-(D/E)XK nuclease family protein, partial [Desulfobaccales bacterium]